MAKQMRGRWKRLRTALSGIHLVDRCLMLFMLVLLAQSAYSMLFRAGTGTGVSDIDIIVRTSSAAIFGYFLSANFIRHTPSTPTASVSAGPPAVTEAGPQDPSVRPRGQIGFTASPPQREPEGGGAASTGAPPGSETACGRLQVIVAASIGLFCLVTLLMLRDAPRWSGGPDSVSIAATAAQFRDFVSGCVGFLIGSPTNHTGRDG